MIYPYRNRDALPVKTLLQLGVFASVALPIIAVLIASLVVAGQHTWSEGRIWLLVGTIGTLFAILVAGAISSLLLRSVTERFLALVDICRTYAGGEHSARAEVLGDDEFAQLARSINGLLDSRVLNTLTVPDASTEPIAHSSQKLPLASMPFAGQSDFMPFALTSKSGHALQEGNAAADMLDAVATSLNTILREISTVVESIQGIAEQMREASRHLHERMCTYAKECAASASQVEPMAETVASVVVFVQHAARDAQVNATIANEIFRQASDGHNVLTLASSTLAQLESEFSERLQRTATRMHVLPAAAARSSDSSSAPEVHGSQEEVMSLNEEMEQHRSRLASAGVTFKEAEQVQEAMVQQAQVHARVLVTFSQAISRQSDAAEAAMLSIEGVERRALHLSDEAYTLAEDLAGLVGISEQVCMAVATVRAHDLDLGGLGGPFSEHTSFTTH